MNIVGKKRVFHLLLSLIGIIYLGYMIWRLHSLTSCLPTNPTYQTYLQNAKSTDFSKHKNLDYLKAIDFPFDKNLAQGDNQLIAVVDLPVTSHPDFSQKLLFEPTIQQALQTISQDINLPDAKPNPHGNLITGLINGDHTGVAPHVLVMPIAINSMGYQDATTTSFANATKFLLQKRVPIINHSNTWGTEILFYGKNSDNDQIYDPYQVLPWLKSSDSVLVLAAGNQHQDFTISGNLLKKQYPEYGSLSHNPKILKNLIYVGIFDTKNSTIANPSNYPGADIALQQRFISVPNLPLISTNSHQSYASDLSGTSFATAIVSGSIAWLMSQDETLSAIQATDILLNTAKNPCKINIKNCQAKFYGRGMLNLRAALRVVEQRKTAFWYPLHTIFNRFIYHHTC